MTTELVVHEPFPFNGTDYVRGDVVSAADADDVREHHVFRNYVSPRAVEKPAPMAPVLRAPMEDVK